jgi:hypothetical protein
MAKATIKTASGAIVIIEGTSDEVVEIQAKILGPKRGTVPAETVKREAKKTGKSLGTATDAILAMRESSFFKKPKSLSEIKMALEEQGMIYPITSLSTMVLRLVRRRNLGRIKMNGTWAYVAR